MGNLNDTEIINKPSSASASIAAAGSVRCEGWHRDGGAFSLGPVEWKQCKAEGTVMLTLSQDGEIEELPACQNCWNECLETKGIEVLSSKPISPNDEMMDAD